MKMYLIPVPSVDCSTVETALNQKLPTLNTDTPPPQEKLQETKNYKEDLTQALKELLQNYKIQPSIQVNNNSTPKPVYYVPTSSDNGGIGGGN